MEIPQVSRPYMPGYGIAGPAEGSGLLHWSWAAERLTAARNYWAAERLTAARNYWVATVR